MPTPRQLSDNLTTYSKVTLLRFNSSLWTTECSDFRFERYSEDGEARVITEYRTNDKNARLTKESFGGNELRAVVEGWGHPPIPRERSVTDRRRKAALIDLFLALRDPCDEYLNFLSGRGVTIIADFRVDAEPIPPTPGSPPLQPRDTRMHGGALDGEPQVGGTKHSSTPSRPESGEPSLFGSDSLLDDPMEDFEPTPADEVPEESMGAYYEGALVQRNVKMYERDRKAREACIERYGRTCLICEIDFSQVYPGIGDGFIHVHHLEPVSSFKREYQLNPTKDLIPVCPNCHAMLHKRKPPYTPEEVRTAMRKGRGR